MVSVSTHSLFRLQTSLNLVARQLRCLALGSIQSSQTGRRIHGLNVSGGPIPSEPTEG